MQNIFNSEDRTAIERRFTELEPAAQRQWGKMNVAQMLAHCAVTLETPLGERQEKRSLIGRLIGPLVRASVFGAAPLRRNTPTDAHCVIVDERQFLEEQRRVLATLARLCDRGPSAADQRLHSFFGRMSGQDWGRLIYKHLDHHLRQFGG